MSHKRNSYGIVSHSKEKHNKSIRAADDAIRRLLFAKESVNFNSVAKEARVSKTFLYKNDGLRKRIEEFRSKQTELREPKHLKQNMNNDSKDALIAAKNKRIADLETENKRLKSVLSKKRGEEYDNFNSGGSVMISKNTSNSNREPIYDDDAIEGHSEQEIIILLSALVDQILKLQEEVVLLRKTAYHDNPYADIYSDLCPPFEDLSAFKRYQDVLKKLS